MIFRIQFEKFVDKLIMQMTFESEIFEFDLQSFEFLIGSFLKLSNFLLKIKSLLLFFSCELIGNEGNLICTRFEKLLMLELHFLLELKVLKLNDIF